MSLTTTLILDDTGVIDFILHCHSGTNNGTDVL